MKAEYHYCVKRKVRCKHKCDVDVTPLDYITLCGAKLTCLNWEN